jgi:hypothetical protein
MALHARVQQYESGRVVSRTWTEGCKGEKNHLPQAEHCNQASNKTLSRRFKWALHVAMRDVVVKEGTALRLGDLLASATHFSVTAPTRLWDFGMCDFCARSRFLRQAQFRQRQFRRPPPTHLVSALPRNECSLAFPLHRSASAEACSARMARAWSGRKALPLLRDSNRKCVNTR